MATLEDLTGRTFGRLRVEGRGPNTSNGGARWWCRCVCEKRKLAHAIHLKRAVVQSCGCLRRETAAATGRRTAFRHGHKVGGKETPEYHTWRSLIDRCNNSKNPVYFRYGGRGITVDSRWLGERGFQNFLEDMGPRPPTPAARKRWYSIERKDNDGPYSKDNCCWATLKVQQSNRRSNHLVTHHGRTQTITAWANEVGMSKVTLRWRISEGWPVERALVPPR